MFFRIMCLLYHYSCIVGADIVFITIYLIVIRRKKRMNDLVTQEKEPLGATKVPVEEQQLQRSRG